MKKTSLISALLLAFLAISMFSMLTVSHGSSGVSLSRDIVPLREELVDSAVLEAGLIESQGWWIDIVDAELVANDGKGIYVAVLDTGLLSNYLSYFPPDRVDIKEEWGKGFSYNVAWNPLINDYDWTWNPNRGFITNKFGSGHGTHMTSVLAGFATATRWYRGVAPKVTIIPVLVLDTWFLPCPDPNYPGYHNGYVLFRGGSFEMIAAGINYIADLAEEYNIKIIINLSLGGPLPNPIEEMAIDYAISKGVIVVAAAGNSGEFGMGWPAAYPQAISVAAGGWTDAWYHIAFTPAGIRADVPEKLNTMDRLGNNWQIFLEDFSSRPNPNYYYAGFSTRQTWIDLDVCTPGQAIVGPYKPYIYWSGTAWINPSIGYYYVWGTSPAAPHVSGIAAMVAQCYPEFEQFDMEWVLKKAAVRIPLASDGAGCYDLYPTWYDFYWNDHDYGSGWLQADEALFVASTHLKQLF